MLSVVGGAFGAECAAEGTATSIAEAATPSPSPSPAAHEFALTMHRFDPALTDKEIHDIAKGIDDAWKAGRKLHKGLLNGDPPSPAFEIGE